MLLPQPTPSQAIRQLALLISIKLPSAFHMTSDLTNGGSISLLSLGSDTSVFDPDLSVLRQDANITGIPDAQYYGPLYLTDVLETYPGPVIFGLNRGAGNLSNTVLAATYVKHLPNLYAVELGNEPFAKPNMFESCRHLNIVYPYTGTSYTGNSVGPTLIVVEAGGASAWTPTYEATTEVEYQLAVGNALDITDSIQAGAYYLSPSYGYNATYLLSQETPEALKYVRSFSHHFYPQTISSKAIGAPAPNVETLMSHVNTSTDVAPYALDRTNTESYDLDYVFGETNSVSGGGSPIVSPMFGAGLWVLDYVLRAASSQIVRLNFHFQSYGTSYYIWWDKTTVRSPYYGGYVATEALAGESYISALDNGTTNYAGYAIYSASKSLSKVVLINTDYFDGNGARSTQDFVLSGLSCQSVSAKRLTAANALSRQDFGQAPTFAGQSFSNSTCALGGKKVIERVSVKDGKATFTLFASEALVISL
ncbi:hypothetical protein G7Y89_g10114 [Cudoniella acicularis]|uniref:Beta-glucuronidase C-terminal domain-containing protein n=1 Tax=Cudoniella acicularis TaxID=354080 RepID=A0A8H4RDD4_9HELO|nr:hypothetical protein G7Y89_g10114 [Cudoniella acicularis]